jgi:hypothetical protein
MRRSLSIKLTLLPLLASAALAHADAPGETVPLPPPEPASAQYIGFSTELAPPGLAPTIVAVPCDDDPDQPWCGDYHHGVIVGVVRGGFGHYFHPSGG